MTGRYPMRHGLQVGVVRPWAQYGLPLEERTLPQALKDAGYATAIFGKWHLGHFAPEYLPTRRGFDHQYGHYNGALDYFTHVRDGGFDWHRDDKACRDEGYSTHLLAKEAVEVHRRHRRQEAVLPVRAVQRRPRARTRCRTKYTEPYAEPEGRAARSTPACSPRWTRRSGRSSRRSRRPACAKNTLFVFSSDNGGPQPGVVTDNGKFRAGKGTLYEGGVRVAAFATWDGQDQAGHDRHRAAAHRSTGIRRC